MLASWVVFAAVVLGLCLGAGLTVERCSGRRLPGVLLVPTGLATVLVLVNLFTAFEALSDLALAAVIVLAVAGFLLGARRVRESQPDWWAVAAAVGVFAVFAAPAALSGRQTFSGSLVLPDTANQLLLAKRIGTDGREYLSLPESSYKVSLNKYLATQYPVAAQSTVGVLRPLGMTEIAWLYQPFIALLMAAAALALYYVLWSWSGRRALSAAGAFLAAQPALTYSYALQGSIKEIAALSMFCTVVALVTFAVQARAGARAFVPLVAAAVAMLASLGPAAAPYLVIPVMAVGLPWLWRLIHNLSWSQVGWGMAALALAALALLPFFKGFAVAYEVNTAVLSMVEDLGNLAAPLEFRQGAGVWLAADFRYPPDYLWQTSVLVLIILVAAAAGIVAALRRRAFGPLLFIGTLLPVSIYLLHRGSPYADGKVLALAAPGVVLAAGVAVIVMADHRRLRALAIAVGLVVGVAVLGSNALAYRGVQNAPGERYAELLKIEGRFAGEGPALLTEYDEYAGYLLARLQIQAEPESALAYQGPPYRRPNGLTDRRHRPGVKSALDIDDLDPGYLQKQRLIVARRSPAVSRPPANYRRVFRGTYYDVWRRDPRGPRVVAHLPLGRNALSPSAVARCGQVRALGRRAQRLGGQLAFVARPGLVSTNPLRGETPRGWFMYGAYPGSLVTSGPGRLDRKVRLPAGGSYRIWIGGSFNRAVHVSVDGKPVGSVSYEPGNPGQYFPLKRVRLDPGPHLISVLRGGGDLRPGDAGGARGSLAFVTPVVLSPEIDEGADLQTIAPDRATDLCGRRLDWIEIVRDRR